MKNFIAPILIGLLIRHGSADVSHLSKHSHNGYLPPQPGHNLFIEQDYNDINSPQSDNEIRGYLPPYQEDSQYHNHDHQNSQQGDRGYLPPPITSQEQSHNNIRNQQLDTHLGYLPPSQGQSHEQQNQDNHGHQEDRGYLPPYQQQFGSHDQHHNTQQYNQEGVDPNLQVSYYNNYAISLQPDGINHDHSKGSNSAQEYVDNSQGYNYSPPNYAFEEGHQQHHQISTSMPQSAANVVQTSQNSFQDHVQPSQEAHHGNHLSNTQSNSKQNLDNVPLTDINLEYQNEGLNQQVTRDYLPPSPLSPVNTQTHIYQAEQGSNSLPSINQIEGTGESHEEDEQDHIPPIGALELPQSSDTLHIVPPSKLGLPIQKSKSQPETSHINVALPIPQAGYYFIPGVVTKLETKTEHPNSASKISANVDQQQQYQQHVQQQKSGNEISPAEYYRPSNSGILIIPSIQTAQDISIQGYLTPSQVVSQHDEHFADIDFTSPNSNHLEMDQQNFPPLVQQNQFVTSDQQLEQNQNEVQNPQQQDDQLQSLLVNQLNQISRPLGPSINNHQENSYLPPFNYQQQQTFQNQEAYSQKQSEAEIHNQVINLQTYMENVNPNDRYGSLQFQPQQAIESNPPPVNPPIMYSKPSAIEAYAPGMAYKVSNNVPFNSFTQAGYLPPAGSSKPEEKQQEYLSSIGYVLNEQVKKDLNQQKVHDNTIFPIADILSQDDEMSQIMEQLQSHIRTIQITNHQDHSVRNIKVLDSSNQEGERTIEILGQSNEDPRGYHKTLHVLSKVPAAFHQTIKIFNDNKEVAVPTNNEYLPPPSIDSNIHKFRRSY